MSISAVPDHIAAHRILIKTLRTIDSVLPELGYERFEVPALAPALIPESYLDIYATEYRFGNVREALYLTPSPELYLKRLIAAGAGSCYSLMRCYRNGEPDSERHSGEFTMLELYKVHGDYFAVADDVLHLFRSLAQKIHGTQEIPYQETTIRFDRWDRITVAEAFRKYADIATVHDESAFLASARAKGYVVDGFSYTDIWSQVYAQEVEPHLGTLGRPALIYEYPRSLAATAEVDVTTGLAKRLEIYINGLELGNCGNASSAGMDYAAMRTRLHREDHLRRVSGKTVYNPDYEFVDTLAVMPPTAGIALGVERLAMIFANAASLRDLAVVNHD